jgi:hypothetical protein
MSAYRLLDVYRMSLVNLSTDSIDGILLGYLSMEFCRATERLSLAAAERLSRSILGDFLY